MDVRAIFVNVTNVSFIGWDDRVRDTLQQNAAGR